MKRPLDKGFTIIEVMLFLAVSGLMAVLLLGGWTLMINTQRYKDTVDTVYGYMQDQYNLVYNVENERGQELMCTSGGVSEGASDDFRGQSDCVLMGRFIKLVDGKTFQSYAVVGQEPDGDIEGDDNDAIREYNPTVVTQSIGLSEAEQPVPWDGTIVGMSGSDNARSLNILLLRSPVSGIVHRYIVNSNGPMDLTIDGSDISDNNENQDVTLCFEPGVIVQGGRQAVVIREYASSRNSVETLAGSDNGC